MNYAVHTWRKCFIKILTQLCVAPTARTWTQLTMLMIYWGSATQHVSHSDFQIGQSQGQSAPVLRESWPTDHWKSYCLFSGVTDWRLWFEWMVDTWNRCPKKEANAKMHRFICCRALLCSTSISFHFIYLFAQHTKIKCSKSMLCFAVVYRALPWYCDKK